MNRSIFLRRYPRLCNKGQFSYLMRPHCRKVGKNDADEEHGKAAPSEQLRPAICPVSAPSSMWDINRKVVLATAEPDMARLSLTENGLCHQGGMRCVAFGNKPAYLAPSIVCWAGV